MESVIIPFFAASNGFLFVHNTSFQTLFMKSQDIEHLKNVLQKTADLTEADRFKLLELLNTFSGYGLVWIDKQEEDENKILNGQMPILRENHQRYIKARKETPQYEALQNGLELQITLANTLEKPTPHHLLIEGDNLPALTALTYTHEEAIDVIYIDPPYNTGNKDFKYNDRFVDKDDPYRHSKWLSFMHKRLLLAKRLLKETALIFISIDDNEQANLKLLCDEVFGEDNFIQDLIWQNKYTVSNDAKFFSKQHDYVLCYAKDTTRLKINLLEKTKEAKARYRNPDNDDRGDWKATPLDARSGSAANIFEMEFPNGITWKPTEGRYAVYSKEKLLNLYSANRLWFGKKGHAKPSKKTFATEVAQGMKCGSILKFDLFGHTHKANDQLSEILGKGKFTSPKPTDLIEKLLELTTSATTDSPPIILDFFAGSGTTLHAVMQLNAKDNGNRQCILVTNNENNIAEEVCYERNKRVIEGYTKPNGGVVKGLTNNHLHYYTLEWFDELATPLSNFVSRNDTKLNEQHNIHLARLMRELLMIKENCFKDIEVKQLKVYHPKLTFADDDHPDLNVLENGEKYMLIIYTNEAIADGIHIIKALPNKEKPIVVYLFDYQGVPDASPFEHLTAQRILLKALPHSYKKTYDHILEDLTKRRQRFVISEDGGE